MVPRLGFGLPQRVHRPVAFAFALILSVTSFIPAASAAVSPVDVAPTKVSAPVAAADGRPTMRTELPGRRTETSGTFDLGDGRLQTEFSTDPIFYRPAGSTAFEPIDLGFRADAKTRVAKVTAAPVRVSVGSASDGVVALDWGAHRIAFRPIPSAALADLRTSGRADAELDTKAPLPSDAPVIDALQADVAGILPGVSLRVVAQAYGASSFLVLDRPIADTSFTFLVSAPGLTLRPTDRGALEFVDNATGKPIAEIPAPYAVDSTPDEFTGSGRTTTAVAYELGVLGKNQTVTIAVDAYWLEKAVYPVYVDPTTTVYNPGSSAFGDTHVNQGNPDFNYANYQRPDSPGYYEMWLGESPSDSTYWNEAFLKFDTSQFAGQAVDAATMTVFPYHQYYDAPTATNAYIRRVTEDWAESITWNTRPYATTTGTGVIYEGCVEGAPCGFDVTAMTRGWFNGTYTNYGVQLSEINTSGVRQGPTYWKRLIASEQGGTNRPKLIVTYHDPVSIVYPSSGPTSSRTLSWLTDATWGQSAYSVQVASDPGFNTIVAASGNTAGAATSWTIPLATSLTAGATYYWRVDARSNKTQQWWSTWTEGSFVHDLPLLGSQAQHRYESWDLGGGDSMSVDASTLNAVVNHPIVSLPIRGGGFGLSLTYNAQDPVSVGMSRGWRLNAFRRLSVNPANGWVTLTDESGARHTFSTPTGSGTLTYTRPPTIYADLTRDTAATPDRFTLTYRDRSADVFEELVANSGFLVTEKDRYQNAVTFGYTGMNLTTIDDPSGRRIDLTWTAGNLTQIQDWAYVSGGVVQASATGSRRTQRFFYDASSRLAGWADPLNTVASCPATPTTNTASHLTCLGYDANGYLTTITKAQSIATLSGGVIGTAAPRSITTQINNAGTSEVREIRDAEHEGLDLPNTFGRTAGLVEVIRKATPDSTTRYAVPPVADGYGRITSVKRKLGGTWIEQLTAFDATYPTEPASVTENNGALLSTPARTTWWTFVVSSLGLVSRMTEPLDGSTHRTTDFTYNANNDVTQKIVALDGSATVRTITRFCYDASCTTSGASTLTMSKEIDNYVDGTAGNGAANVEDVTTAYQYDAYGQQTRSTRSNYNAAGTLLDSAATGQTYDGLGNLTAEIANYVSGTVTNPGDDITPNATTNARTDLTTAYTYDTAGNQVSSADPRRSIEVAKATTLAADDFISRSTYDPLGQTLTAKLPTTVGISDCSPTPACRTTSSVFDELGRTRESTDQGGVVSGTEADRLDHATRTFEDTPADPPAVTSTTTFDASGRILTAKDRNQSAAGSTLGSTSHTYDELGRETDAIDASGSSPDVASITHRTFDSLHRRITEITGYGGPSAQATTSAYDLGGRAITVDDEFTCTSTTYDYRDLATQTIEGQSSGACSGSGIRTTAITNDSLGRKALRAVTAGTGLGDQPESNSYDAAGNVLATSGTQGGVTTTSTFTVNVLDQAIVETRTDGSTAKTNYDAAGNATDRCYWKPSITVGACLPADTVSWTNPPTQAGTSEYDARNQRIKLVSRLGSSSTAATTTYDPAHNSQIKAFYLPTHYNGSSQRDAEAQDLYTYDTRHRPASITHQSCAVTANTDTCTGTVTPTGYTSYAYDDNDNRTTVTESSTAGSGSATTRTYCYDALNRLTASKGTTACTSSPDEANVYDDAGNRTSTTAAGSTRTFTYDAEGQLASCATPACTVTYDASGRSATITDNGVGWTFAYDADGRVISACKSTACSGAIDRVEYLYDGSGHRIQIKETTSGGVITTTDLRYQGDTIVQELVGGTVSRTYATDDTGRIVEVCDPDCSSGTIYVVVYNGHGDATGLWKQETTGALTLANSYTYSTWGTPTTTVNTGAGFSDLKFRFLYVGASDVQWDASFGLNLAYMHARHYSPALGRFIQPDPAAAEANLYGYATNSPVTVTDPCGTLSLLEFFRCRNLRNKITNLRNELVRRQHQMFEDTAGLRFGPNIGRSLQGEQIQFVAKQKALRKLLNDFDNSRCGPKPPFGYGQKLPVSVRFLAWRPMPKYGGKFAGNPSPGYGNHGLNWGPAAAAAGSVTIAGILWWILKPAAVFCGPFAPACAVAF